MNGWRTAVLVGLVFLVGVLPACDDTAATDWEEPTYGEGYVYALYDLEEGVMPTPTDVVHNEETGRLDVPADDDDTEAHHEFTAYLNELDGWPVSTPIRIPMSAPVEEESLHHHLYLVREHDGERMQIEAQFDHDTDEIVVEPVEQLEPGTEYHLGLRAYREGVVGAQGEMVIADSMFYLLASYESLSDHPDAMPGSSAEERQQTADELAQLQQRMQPVFSSMASHGILREHLAVAFGFTTSDKPSVQYDAAQGKVPMPNDLLRDSDGEGIELPIDSSMTEEEQQIREVLSARGGFSTSGALTAESTHNFGEGVTTDQALKLYERDDDTGEWNRVGDVERGRFDDPTTVYTSPELALEPATDYVWVLTDELLTDDGRAHRAQPLGAITRLRAELVDDDGNSQLDLLSDEEARRIEPVRQVADELLTSLEKSGVLQREDIAAAVPFRTDDNPGWLLERRARLYEEDISTEVTNIETTDPSGAAGLLLDEVETVVRGEMTVLDYLDPVTRTAVDHDDAVQREVSFALTLPEPGAVSIDEPVPVVLFGHGLMTSRELLYLIASELAKAGYAAFAVDLPHHGSRAPCLSDGECQDDGTCREDGVCVDDDGEEVDLLTIELSSMLSFLRDTQYDDLLNYPVSSGHAFIDLDSLAATSDAFGQGLLDLSQALRVIRGEELQEAILPQPGHTLDDEILYLGMSLGGILGGGLVAVEPEIETFVLNVPGADMTTLIESSATFETLYAEALEERDIEKDSDEYFEFINAARWLLDPIDPLNLAQHAVEDPLEYTDPVNGEVIDDRQARVQIQMAEGDLVVPNIGTEILSQRMGVDYNAYDPSVTDHAFLFDPTGLSTATRTAREDMIEFFDDR